MSLTIPKASELKAPLIQLSVLGSQWAAPPPPPSFPSEGRPRKTMLPQPSGSAMRPGQAATTSPPCRSPPVLLRRCGWQWGAHAPQTPSSHTRAQHTALPATPSAGGKTEAHSRGFLHTFCSASGGRVWITLTVTTCRYGQQRSLPCVG